MRSNISNRASIITEQNLILNSNITTSWSKSNVTVDNDSIDNPIDGQINGKTYTDTNFTGLHFLSPGSDGAINKSLVTISSYVKSITGRYIALATNNALQFVVFDLQNGTTGSVTNSIPTEPATAGIISLPNGWYRIYMTYIKYGTPYTSRLYTLNNTATFSYAGTSSISYYIYGLNASYGTFLSPYVETAGSAINNDYGFRTTASNRISVSNRTAIS